MRSCVSCQKNLGPEETFCAACGRTVGLDWVWILYGTTLIMGLQGVLLGASGMLFLGDQVADALAHPASAGLFWVVVQLTTIAAFGYFLGGVLIGRMSSASTILEPALAAAFPAAVFLGYLLSSLRRELSGGGMFWWAIFFSVLVVIACFLVALGGGYCGERWQRYAERRAIVDERARR